MKPTNEQLKAFAAITKTTVTHYINSSKLEIYIASLFPEMKYFQFLEASNDSAEFVNIEKNFEAKFIDEKALIETEQELKSGAIEVNKMQMIFSWLYYHKHIPEGDYIITFSW